MQLLEPNFLSSNLQGILNMSDNVWQRTAKTNIQLSKLGESLHFLIILLHLNWIDSYSPATKVILAALSNSFNSNQSKKYIRNYLSVFYTTPRLVCSSSLSTHIYSVPAIIAMDFGTCLGPPALFLNNFLLIIAVIGKILLIAPRQMGWIVPLHHWQAFHGFDQQHELHRAYKKADVATSARYSCASSRWPGKINCRGRRADLSRQYSDLEGFFPGRPASEFQFKAGKPFDGIMIGFEGARRIRRDRRQAIEAFNPPGDKLFCIWFKPRFFISCIRMLG